MLNMKSIDRHMSANSEAKTQTHYMQNNSLHI